MRFFLFWIIIASISCTGVQKAKKIQNYIVANEQAVAIGPRGDSIAIHYTGCGGFLIQQAETAILLDPYFSNLSPLIAVPFKRLKTDTAQVDEFFASVFNSHQDQQGLIKAILVAHSHYDHLADVPVVYRRNCNTDSTQIIGSKTTHHILTGAGIDNSRQILAPYGIGPKEEPKDHFQTRNGQLRITPVASEHAPHFAGIKVLPCKQLKKDKKKFPRKAINMPEGQNFNFLIDFLDENGQIAFRIFSHAGSSCDGGVGLPPADVLAEKDVDLLLLCVASFSQVENYPDVVLDQVNPRHIILNHWENFFRPLKKLEQKPATVPGTNVEKFIHRLEQMKSPSTDFTLPQPGTKIVLHY